MRKIKLFGILTALVLLFNTFITRNVHADSENATENIAVETELIGNTGLDLFNISDVTSLNKDSALLYINKLTQIEKPTENEEVILQLVVYSLLDKDVGTKDLNKVASKLNTSNYDEGIKNELLDKVEGKLKSNKVLIIGFVILLISSIIPTWIITKRHIENEGRVY